MTYQRQFDTWTDHKQLHNGPTSYAVSWYHVYSLLTDKFKFYLMHTIMYASTVQVDSCFLMDEALHIYSRM